MVAASVDMCNLLDEAAADVPPRDVSSGTTSVSDFLSGIESFRFGVSDFLFGV